MEALTRGIVNKIAHGPISELRNHAGHPEGAHVIAAIRKAFQRRGLIMLVIASRGSQLALWQARWVAAQLAARGHDSRIEIIKTTGDKITDVPLAQVGGKGLFTKEIEEALLDGRADLAVHSLKDLPTELPEGLVLAAVPEREDPRDALVGQAAGRTAQGRARSAPALCGARRSCASCGPDLTIESVRGNLDTRLRKLDEGQYDAIVLAAAGLKRLGWADRIAEILPAEVMCPAVGQGALAIETRHRRRRPRCLPGSGPSRDPLCGDRRARSAGGLGGGCQVPIGAHASAREGRLTLVALVASPDGSEVVRGARKAEVSMPLRSSTVGTERIWVVPSTWRNPEYCPKK